MERAKTLKELREAHALSMAELAQRMTRWLAEHEGTQLHMGPRGGLSTGKQAINTWENTGIKRMRPWSKRALAGVYGVTIADIEAAIAAQNAEIAARKSVTAER